MEEDDDRPSSDIEALLGSFDFELSCSFSKLEFKRVVLQNLNLLLRYMQEEQSFWAAVARTTTLRDRKCKIMVNILAWIGRSMPQSRDVRERDPNDERYRMRAEIYIRNAIINLWKRFDTSVDKVTDRTKCLRAREAPLRRKNGRIDLTIHEGKCSTRGCDNAGFIRSNIRVIRTVRVKLEELKRAGELTPECVKMLTTLDEIDGNYYRLYNYKTCLSLGDFWIHLEAVAAGVKDLATTNYKESQILCPLLGITMQLPQRSERFATSQSNSSMK